jgi:hypothetical protein
MHFCEKQVKQLDVEWSNSGIENKYRYVTNRETIRYNNYPSVGDPAWFHRLR